MAVPALHHKDTAMTEMAIRLRSIPDTKAAIGWAGGKRSAVTLGCGLDG